MEIYKSSDISYEEIQNTTSKVLDEYYRAGFEHGREFQEEIDNELLDKIRHYVFEYMFDENISAKSVVENIRKLIDEDESQVIVGDSSNSIANLLKKYSCKDCSHLTESGYCMIEQDYINDNHWCPALTISIGGK